MSFSSSDTSGRGISLPALGWYAALVRAFTDEQAFWIVSDAAHGASVASLMKKHGFTRAQFAK